MMTMDSTILPSPLPASSTLRPHRPSRRWLALLFFMALVCTIHAAGWHRVRIIADGRGTCVRTTPSLVGSCSAARAGNVSAYLPAGQSANGVASAMWWDGGHAWLWVRWHSDNAPAVGWVRADVLERVP